ncbi:MAG: hypothetical protein JW704_02090 [Anaerolineaceae bacterium]|nr:hypothetical protein [Anaerolineaceae bacterium]MBN2677539.1 hypothetical protein [Anaerolineaceae bacterium]
MLDGDLIWSIISFILTILVFSYLAGDNVFFRIIIYAFIGMSAAYVSLIVITQVVWPYIVLAIIQGALRQQLIGLTGLLMCILLCAKLIPRLTRVGNLPMAYLVGIGGAIVIGGAVTGTIIPQFIDTFDMAWIYIKAGADSSAWSPVISGALILIGVQATLIYFHYGARKKQDGKINRRKLIEVISGIGQIFIAISLGSIFSGVLSASVTAMVERISFMVNLLRIMGM